MIKSDSETRRTKMTKRLMKDALMELMENEPLASVSITELCALADVNRSTFYSYYTGTLVRCSGGAKGWAGEKICVRFLSVISLLPIIP